MSFSALVRYRLKGLADWLFLSALFEPGWGLLRPTSVEISRLPLSESDKVAIATAARGGRRVHAAIAGSAFLRRSQVLPRAAMSKSDGAISVEMRQAFPAQAAGLVWRSVLEGVRDGKAEYVVYVARKDQLEALREAVEKAGGVLTGIGISSVGSLIDLIDSGAARRRWMIGTASIALASAVVALVVLSLRTEAAGEQADKLEADLAEMQVRAVQLRADQEQQASLQSGQLSDLSRFEAGRGRARLLHALSETLPDATWISEMTLSGDDLVLSGFSASDVSEVLEALQSIDLLSAPQLAGPALVDGLSGETRFQVRATVHGGSAK